MRISMTRRRRQLSAAALSVAALLAAAPAHADTGYADGGTWGGYVATGAQGDFQNISGSWVEPQASCSTTADTVSTWVGIDGGNSQSSTIEQTGVEIDCSSGAAQGAHTAWYQTYSGDRQYWNDTVNAGDSMTGSVCDEGDGTYTLTLTDNTQGWTETTTQSSSGQDASAEAVIETPQGVTAPFINAVVFSNITVNGQVFDQANPQATVRGANGFVPNKLNNGGFAVAETENG